MVFRAKPSQDLYGAAMKAKLYDLSELTLISTALGCMLEEQPNLSADLEIAIRALLTKTDALVKTIELLAPLTSAERLELTSQYAADESVLAHAEAILKQRHVDTEAVATSDDDSLRKG